MRVEAEKTKEKSTNTVTKTGASFWALVIMVKV